MADVKKSLLAAATTVEHAFDRLRRELKERFGRYDPILLQPYRGYGNTHTLFLMGRVLEDSGIGSSEASDSPWRNFRKTLKRLETDEIPHACVRGCFRGQTWEAETDAEGFFKLKMPLPAPPSDERVWHDVELELVEAGVPFEAPVRAVGQVLVPPATAEFGVISDIDDTVLVTGATDKLRMITTTLLNNARTRLPFEGVAAFYRALQLGGSGIAQNPIFYVSSSPWNIYDLLVDFLDVHGIPVGPLFLKDYGIAPDKFISSGHQEHKLGCIRVILDTYPDLPFVLVGDSGQEDPEIYRQVVHDHPKRILAVYIRDVSLQERDREIHTLAEGLRGLGVEMVFVEDTVTAARHALSLGLTRPEAPAEVGAEKAADEARPTAADQVLGTDG